MSRSSDGSSLRTYDSRVLNRPPHGPSKLSSPARTSTLMSTASSSDGSTGTTPEVSTERRLLDPELTKTGSPLSIGTLLSTSSDSDSTASPDVGIPRRMSGVPELPSEEVTPKAEVPPATPRNSRMKVATSDEVSSPEVTSTSSLSYSHFPIIYPPPAKAAPQPSAPALRCEDARTLEREFAEGGVTASVYSPDDAISWLESHYDDPLLESLRARNFQGPIAMQLGPAESALVVFGSIADAMIPKLAKALAQASKFAVMVRSSVDNPLLSFAQGDVTTPKAASTASSEKPAAESTEQPTAVPTEQPLTVSTEQPAARLRGGAADPDDDDDEYYEDDPQTTMPEWEGQRHNATVALELKLGKAAYKVTLSSHMQFKTQSLNGSNSAKPRPEVLSFASLEVKLRRGETTLDRSFSNIGFLVDRPQSIVTCDFLPLDYAPPDTKLKHTTQHSSAITAGGGVSLTGVVPTVSANAAYTRNWGDGSEAADEKPMPKCKVQYDMGKAWESEDAEKLGKDFGSYDVQWRPEPDRDNVAHEMQVEFGLGLHLRHDKRLYNDGMPLISSVLRNQILVWVSDPALRTKGRGILLLTSTYIPKALTDKHFTIYKTSIVNLSQDPPVDVRARATPSPVTAGDAATKHPAMSVSVAPVDKSKKRRPPSVFGKFLDKLSFKPSPPEDQDTTPDLPMYETVSRGWDASNMRWKSVIWPTLDHTFHGIPDNSEKATWKLRWTPDPVPVASTSTAGGTVPASSVGPIPVLVVSQARGIPKSSAPSGLSTISSRTTEVSDTAQYMLFDPDGGQDAATLSTSVGSSFVADRKKS
ncbi:hypothetical protein FB451DRAFT_1213734 [Mycena latifolia]|nr:hypothetical protein FB451DRAFT_1213734 [Mycena latifolia]